MPIEVEVTPTLADVLTLTGAAVSAALVTTFVELAKIQLPIIGRRGWEQALALWASLLLVVLASVDRHMATGVTSLNDVFVSIIAWLAIAKLATGIHDEAANVPTSLRAAATRETERADQPPAPVV